MPKAGGDASSPAARMMSRRSSVSLVPVPLFSPLRPFSRPLSCLPLHRHFPRTQVPFCTLLLIRPERQTDGQPTVQYWSQYAGRQAGRQAGRPISPSVKLANQSRIVCRTVYRYLPQSCRKRGDTSFLLEFRGM